MNYQAMATTWNNGLAYANRITLPLWPGAERICGDFECS